MACKAESSALSRKFRVFLRWMRDNGVEYSDGLVFELGGSGSVADIGVKALFDMEENDLIATIPKQSCLTLLTTASSSMLDELDLDADLSLAVALMYERSLQERSKWYGYLQLLPNEQNLPFLWTTEEIDKRLAGTELHKAIKEERLQMEEDWKVSIAPLTDLNSEEFPAKWFTLERYLAAKSLVSSRAFEVDDYHGYGMVPLADLFNHKTADEDVHFTLVDSSESESDDSDPEVHETSPVKRLKNEKKQDNQTDFRKHQDQPAEKSEKSAKKKPTRLKDGRLSYVDDKEIGINMKPEVPGKTRLANQNTGKKSDPDFDKASDLTATDEKSKRRSKRGQAVKHEAEGNFKTEKLSPGRQKSQDKGKLGKVKEHENREIELKEIPLVRQNGKKIDRHHNEMESEDRHIEMRSRKDCQSQKHQQILEGPTDVYRNTRTGGKLAQIKERTRNSDHELFLAKPNENRKRSLEGLKSDDTQKHFCTEAKESIGVSPEAWEGNSELLEMILVKDVAGGSEVFNTYGTLSNAALLHRYGFTEPNNPFDIINIDLSSVVDSVKGAFTTRHVRRRISTWKKVGWSQECEYFEISATGKPEKELLMLLYIVHLSDDLFETLQNSFASSENDDRIETAARLLGWEGPPDILPVTKKSKRSRAFNNLLVKGKKQKLDLESWLLTSPVCRSMLEVLRSRDSLYPTDSLEDDKAILSSTSSLERPQEYHSLALRISERSILRLCMTNVSTRLNLLSKSTFRKGR